MGVKAPRKPKTALDSETAGAVADRFKILSDPTRVRLLAALAEKELCVRELTEMLGMNQSAVSHQLSSLRTWQLVNHRKVGRQVFYRLKDEHIEQLLTQSVAHVESL